MVVKRVTKKKIIFLVLMGVILGFAGGYTVAPYVMQTFASYLIYPLLCIQHTYIEPLKELCAHKRDEHALQECVTRLQADKDALTAQLIAMQATATYNDDMQEISAFKKRYECAHALQAQIIARHASPQEHSMLVDAGALQGTQKDMVVVYKNILLGRVTEVYPHYSKVILITDHTCKVAAYCATTKATGIHVGTNTAGATQLHHVSHLTTLQEQDVVLSSGEGLVFPRGFGLGRIKQFQVNGLLYDVTIEPLCDIATIGQCYLLQKGNEFALKDEEPAVDMISTSTATDQATPTDMVSTTTEYRGIDRRRRHE